MSDRIKKIKIKQSDGTFSDYIPIGADAKNIDTTRGESVQSAIDKTARYYNSIAEMKLDNNIQIGDTCVTLGYYEANDGGSGTYRIVDNSSLEDDGGSIHELNNGLKAQLIIKDNQINVKQFGAYGDGEHDDTNAIQNAINSCNTIDLNKDSIFLLSNSIEVHSNLKIFGNPSTKIIARKDFNIFTYTGLSEKIIIYEYNFIDTLNASFKYGFEINGKKYEFLNKAPIKNGGTFLINLVQNILIIIDSDSQAEYEYDIQNVNNYNKETITLILGDVLSNLSWTLPKEYCENLTIDGIIFENNIDTHSNSSLIYLSNCKNSHFINNQVYNIGLIKISLTLFDDNADSEKDIYIYRGLNTKILNKNIYIENNIVLGKEEKRVEEIVGSQGIVLRFSKDCIISNNTIKNFVHAISLWGGNVGTAYFWKKDALNFLNNIFISNNNISNMKAGGIWSSRSQDLKVINNFVSICGDVNIDFEGSKACLANNNVCYDSKNGCLATLFNSYDIIFSNNYCEDTGYFENGKLVLNHCARVSYQKIEFNNNIFICKNKQIRIGIQGPGENTNSQLIFNGNSFINVTLIAEALGAPQLFITNNTFESTDAALNTKYNIISIRTSNYKGTEAIISNNVFLIKSTITGANYKNNEDFIGIYPIHYYRGVWTGRNNIIIRDNVIKNFPNSILIEKTLVEENYAHMYINLINNIISGTIDNHSTRERNYLYLENNKTYFIETSNNTTGRLSPYPSSIPIASEEYICGYCKNSIICFESPDSDGYTKAICIESGYPGTWKRFGKIEE